MSQRRLWLNWLVFISLLFALLPLPVLAAPPLQTDGTCAEEYIVQADDWLSKIAAKFLGDTLAYPAIVTATNDKQAQDASFAQITNSDLIEIGWKVCIPTTAEAQAVLAAAGPVGITDGLGRPVSLVQLPQRFVIAGRATTLMANAFYMFPEAGQRLAGIEIRGQSADVFLPLVDPNYAQKTFLEMNAGPEQIAPLKPDVVILKSFMADKLGAPLEQLGIPVVYVDLETPEQYTRDLAVLGQLFGNPARTQAVLNFYQQRLDRVKAAMDGLAEAQKPRVLLIQTSDQGGEVAFNVPPATWLQTTMTELAGGVPVWTEAAEQGGWTVVGFEQIAAWDPDQVYVVSYNKPPAEVVETLKADPKWQELKAVQNNQVFGFAKDFYSWDQPDSRWILGLLWLATKVQPERAAGIDMQQEVNQFYGQMYGLDQATIDTQVMPEVQGLP